MAGETPYTLVGIPTFVCCVTFAGGFLTFSGFGFPCGESHWLNSFGFSVRGFLAVFIVTPFYGNFRLLTLPA